MSYFIKKIQNDTNQPSLTITNTSASPSINLTADPEAHPNPMWSVGDSESSALQIHLDNSAVNNDLWIWADTDASGVDTLKCKSDENGTPWEVELPEGTDLKLHFTEQSGIIIIGTADLGDDEPM